MRLPRFARTVTFKLALTQAALFAASAALLFAAVYWSMVSFARAQLQAQISVEITVLAETRATDGFAELVRTVEGRAKDRGPEGHGYLLWAADGRRLAGNLRIAKPMPGWQIVGPAADDLSSTDDETHAVMAFGAVLPSGEFILVGRDTRELDHVREVIAQTFAGASAVTLAAAIAGGILTSLGFLRQIESINATTRQIMAGDLNKRIPVKGTGDEFDRLAQNLNGMLERIQSLMEGLRQVSNDIAHDLRTPLTHLRQRLESARAGVRSNTDYDAIVEATIADTDEILKVFAALLRIAQIEAGSRRSGFADVDLSKVFATILDVYGPVAEDVGQSLGGSIAPGIHMSGDRELLMQMIANLVENAIRYAGAGARIGLTLSVEPQGVRAIVSDTGPGIAPELREKVFRRLFRAETHRGSEGNGLGLALVRAVGDLHAITIRLLDNAPGLLVELDFPPAAEMARDLPRANATPHLFPPRP